MVTPGTVLSMLLCASAPFLLVFVVPRGYRAPGFLGMVARLVVLMSGAVVLAYPAGMLLTPGAEPHRQVVLTAAAAPLVALAIAWWFSDFGPRTLSRVAVRAAVLLALCVLAALVTRGNVMYGGTRGWTGICAATIAVLLCVATWRITDLHGPSGILKRAGFVLVACIGIAVLAHAHHVPLVTRPSTGSGTQLWITLLLTGLLVFAVALLVSAAFQRWDVPVLGRLRRGLLGGRRAGAKPQPGEIWLAEFPFEEEDGSKQRPVLVVEVHSDTADVCKITGTDLSRYGGIALPLSEWRGILSKDSWLDPRRVPLPYPMFYKRMGRCRPELWARVQAMDLPYRDDVRIPAPRRIFGRQRA